MAYWNVFLDELSPMVAKKVLNSPKHIPVLTSNSPKVLKFTWNKIYEIIYHVARFKLKFYQIQKILHIFVQFRSKDTLV